MQLDKFKVCPACGEHNPPALLECRKCETDLTGVKVADDAKPTGPVARLQALDGRFSFSITKPVTIIGRESEMSDYLAEKTYVSRKHAKVTMTDGAVSIENLSGTNHTFINNMPIPCDAPVLLKNGDEIGLGGKAVNGERQAQAAYFLFEVLA
jgi:pSer/pThr/pTyr-binding forkhead associated (FHA) protein